MSKENYETSRIFGILKARKDSLDGNLTTSQYLERLDRYLSIALSAMLRHTRYLEGMVAGLIGWQEENYRRRVSLLTKREFVPAALTWLLQDKITKEKTLDTLKLDRGVGILICHAFLSECSEYMAVTRKAELTEQADLQVIRNTEDRLLAPGGNLSHATATVARQAKLAAEYRGAILSKYFRLAIMAAQRDYVSYFNCRISLDDMCSEYITATARAIDKCDYEKGPLTTHIQNWFFTARTHCKRRYDTSIKESSLDSSSMGAYKVFEGAAAAADSGHTPAETGDGNPTHAESGDRSQTSQQDDADNQHSSRPGGFYVSAEQAIEDKESEDNIRLLAKLADPRGFARRRMGIEEILSSDELRLQGMSTAKRRGG